METLAAETITQIFKAASQLEFQDDIFSLPISLLQCISVSRRWHSIALQTPNLYTNIVIPFNALRERNYSILKWTRFWFEQSGTCAVAVTLHLSTVEHRDQVLLQRILFDYIIPHSFRLRAFHFTCPGQNLTFRWGWIFGPLLDLAVDAPKLEELVIHMAVDSSITFLQSPKSIFQSTPNLRKIVAHSTSQIPFAHFTQLVELDICRVNVWNASFRKFVLDNPKLEFLALRSFLYTIAWQEGSSASAPILMNTLRSLTLDWEHYRIMDTNVYMQVFAHVLAPNLEYLEVSASALLTIVNLVNMLPVASSLTRLRKIKLVGLTRKTTEDIVGSQWFKDLPSDSVEEIHLTDTSGEFLGIDFPGIQNDRNVLVPLHDSSLLTSSSTPSFKNLKSLTIESSVAEDMVWLCQVLIIRPNIQTIYLSKHALTVLCEDVLLLPNENSGGWLIGLENRPVAYEKTKDMKVAEWVKQRVQLKVLELE